MRYLFIIPLFLLASATLSCQNGKKKDTPEAVKKTFKAMYPGENDPDWHVDAHGNYESHFKIKGVKYRADYAADGSWIETETNIKISELPKAIQDEIDHTYFLYAIAEIEKVKHHSKGTFYDVEFKQKGKNKDIEFRADGTVIDD